MKTTVWLCMHGPVREREGRLEDDGQKMNAKGRWKNIRKKKGRQGEIDWRQKWPAKQMDTALRKRERVHGNGWLNQWVREWERKRDWQRLVGSLQVKDIARRVRRGHRAGCAPLPFRSHNLVIIIILIEIFLSSKAQFCRCNHSFIVPWHTCALSY